MRAPFEERTAEDDSGLEKLGSFFHIVVQSFGLGTILEAVFTEFKISHGGKK
jgi:hypothetical protein